MLIEAGVAMSSELALDRVLERIVQLAIEITGARYGALGVLADDGSISEFITEGVTPEQRSAIGNTPVGKGILGLLIRERRPIRLPSIGADPRSAGFPPNHPPMESFLGAPVLARGQVFGNIYLTEKQGAVGEIDRAIRDLRNYIFGLRPGILADRLLDSALRDLADEFSARSGVVTVVDLDDSIVAELSGLASDVVQITRECLSNVGRH